MMWMARTSPAMTKTWTMTRELLRLHRRQYLGGVEAKLVEGYVVQAEIGGRRLQRGDGAVPEQLFEARALKDAVCAAEGQRRAGDVRRSLADHVFRAVQRRRRLGGRAFGIAEPGRAVGHQPR